MGRKGTEKLLDSFRAWLTEPLETRINKQGMYIALQFKEMRKQMALNADELKARINEATNNLAGDVNSLKSKLEQALVDQGVAVEAGVQEALSGLDTLATNLENLAASTPEDPIEEPEEPTDPEPEPEVPGEAPDVEPGAPTEPTP